MDIESYLKTIFHKNGIRNILALITKMGSLRLPNGSKLTFKDKNSKDIEELYLFALKYGVKFSNKEGSWNFDSDKDLITTPDGIKFNLRGFNSLIFAETFLYDVHFVQTDLSNKVIIQAGGFIGDTAIYYASRGARVYSFEPSVDSYGMAIRNIGLNPNLAKNIVMKNYALGKDEEIEFPLNDAGFAGSSVFSVNGSKKINVRSVSVSTILKELNVDSPYLLELNVQGKEFDAINDESVSKFKVVRMEYFPNFNKLADERNLIMKKLKQYGFSSFRTFKHNELPFDLNDHGTIEARK